MWCTKRALCITSLVSCHPHVVSNRKLLLNRRSMPSKKNKLPTRQPTRPSEENVLATPSGVMLVEDMKHEIDAGAGSSNFLRIPPSDNRTKDSNFDDALEILRRELHAELLQLEERFIEKVLSAFQSSYDD